MLDNEFEDFEALEGLGGQLMPSKRARINIYLAPELKKELYDFAGEFSMQYTQAANMLLKMGLQTFKRAYTPEKVLSPDDWAMLMKAAKVADETKAD